VAPRASLYFPPPAGQNSGKGNWQGGGDARRRATIAPRWLRPNTRRCTTPATTVQRERNRPETAPYLCPVSGACHRCSRPPSWLCLPDVGWVACARARTCSRPIVEQKQTTQITKRSSDQCVSGKTYHHERTSWLVPQVESDKKPVPRRSPTRLVASRRSIAQSRQTGFGRLIPTRCCDHHGKQDAHSADKPGGTNRARRESSLRASGISGSS